jgi:adenylate cyclase
MPSLRQIRLATGLVLYAYVTLHFANHALGNISVGAMESGLVLQKLIWQSLPGAVILYVSLLAHISLGFWALLRAAPFPLDATRGDPARPWPLHSVPVD